MPDGPTTAFSTISTCDSVLENDRYVQVRALSNPKQTSAEGQVMEFAVAGPGSGEYYVLPDSHLYLRYRWQYAIDTSADDTAKLQAQIENTTRPANGKEDQIAPVAGWTSLLFNRFDMELNGTPVASQMADYDLVNWMHQLVTRTGRDIKSKADNEGWQFDERNLSVPEATGLSLGGKTGALTCTAANPGVWTSPAAHGFVVGDVIQLSGFKLTAAGNVLAAETLWNALSGSQFTVLTVPTNSTFTLTDEGTNPLDTSGYAAALAAPQLMTARKVLTNPTIYSRQLARIMQSPASKVQFEENLGHVKRKMRYMLGGQQFGAQPAVAGFVDNSVLLQPGAGIWQAADVVPSGVDMKLRFTVNKLRKMLVGSNADALAKIVGIEFQEAILMLRRVKMSPAQDAAFITNWQSSPIKYNQNYIRCQRTTVSSNTNQTIRIRNLLPGPMCNKYVVFFLRDDVANGAPIAATEPNYVAGVPNPLAISQCTFNDNAATNDIGCSIKFARLTIGSRDYPLRGDDRADNSTSIAFGQDSTATFQGGATGVTGVFGKTGGRDTSVGYQLYVDSLPDPTDPPLTAEQWAQDIQPLVFDTSLTGVPTIADPIAEGVDVQLEIQLTKLTSQPYAVFVVGYQRSCIEVNSDGTIISDV